MDIKKKEKEGLVNLAREHENKYPELTQEERLKCIDRTPGSYNHLCKTIRDRQERETVIPEEDIEAAIEQIINHPFLGGRKGALKLLEDQKALIGETYYKEIKKQLMDLSEEEYSKRKKVSELKTNQYKRQNVNEEHFEKIETTKCHDVWAIDFTELKLLGIRFYVCVVYDLFSQAYLSVIASQTPTMEVAIEAVEQAVHYANAKPSGFILSDNGSQFLSKNYQDLLVRLGLNELRIPAGKPWYNGALESGNRDIKKTILTIAFYKACINPAITRTGVCREEIFGFLKVCCGESLSVINKEIPRPKFGTTPLAVLNGDVLKKKQERDAFKSKKKKERMLRMKLVKKGKLNSKKKSFEDKVKAIWKKKSNELSIDKLFAFTELLNQRYAAITK